MHRAIFGYSFALIVAPILLSVLAFNHLNKRKTSVRKNASSSPTALTANRYDVFLSFRDIDSRESLTAHLYNGLVDAGIRTFRDDYELRQGEEIDPDLLAAIKNSKILIPMISVNYGSSKWCLDELVQIMECKNTNMGHIVLPIFYKVKPAHVRHQTGSFGDAFSRRERHSDRTIVEKWKQALVEVSSLKGWEADGHEAQLVKSVVQEVLRELRKEFELVIPKNLVGIDSHVEKVMTFIDNNSSATLFVGIHGMGGIGKTTLAKVIYNKLSNQFDYCSFIQDIRELCKRNGLEYLQNQLIADILKQKNQVHNKDEGVMVISSKFKGKKVLILLDDVNDDDQLKALAGNHNWFSSGSKIIITTRNKAVLDNARVDYSFEHESMDVDQSLILFCRHAFRRDSPPSEFEDLTHVIVSTTGRLPLSLVILGSFLRGKRPMLWRDTINKLKKFPHEEVSKTLRISYEALEDEQKQLFLDIACFLVGIDGRMASYMWDACGFFPREGIEVLRSMSLIKVGDNHEFIMHDQLRDLGRKIVREENLLPQYRSRLWDPMEILKVLKENKGTEWTQAIYLSKDRVESSGETADEVGEIYTDEQFKNLKGLRFLHVDGAHFCGDFNNSIQELKWLRWWNCPSTFEANNFYAKELIVLDLSRSKISDKWQGWSSFMMAEKLKFLDLTHCGYLESTFFLSAFKNLEVLILKSCRRLEQIDSSIGDMKALICLDLSGCWSLKELPAEVGKLEALEQLLLKDCRGISKVPGSIGALQNLEILNISGTGIIEIPNGIGRLRKLRDLDASCSEILEVSKSIRNLSSLQRLNFHGCVELQSLPVIPSSLTYLSVTCQNRRWLPPTLLELSECSQLADTEESELPISLNTPFKLEILEIHGCHFMETLDVSQLNHMRTLVVDYCNNIFEVRGLDKLKYLGSLTIRGCASIKRLDLPKSEGLKIFDVGNCENLVKIQGLDRLDLLEELNISWCVSIKRVDLSKSKGLKILDAQHCESLFEIQGLDRLEFLEVIDISSCASIERLDLPRSENLKILNARYCENIIEIQGLDRLKFLEELNISGCTSIEILNLSIFGGLKILDAENCENLFEIQGLDSLEFLDVLNISGCDSIERVDLPKSEGLKKLDAGNCKNLVKIHGLGRLEFLEELDISWCASIKRVDLPKSNNLKMVNARNCECLVEIHCHNRLDFLENLDVSWCPSIERLDLSKYEGLRKLHATYCDNLIEIEGLDMLECLEELYVSGFASIKKLNLPKSECLKILYAEICENLVEIQGLDRLEFLEVLNISGCVSIERLDFSTSKSLKTLGAANCENLIEIQGLDELEFLKVLDISGCVLIKRLDLPKSKDLKILNARYCKSLAEIQGLDGLESLEELNISGCTSIKRLNLSSLQHLKILSAENCEKLVEIESLSRLEFLEKLNISRCTSIERLDLSQFKGLEILETENCENLVEIQGLDRLEFLKVLNMFGCISIERLNLSQSKSLKKLDAGNCAKLIEIQGIDRLFLEVLNISGSVLTEAGSPKSK